MGHHRRGRRAINITLRQLRIFEAVARFGSISRAAAEVHLTQPAVSMQVKQLEDQLGLQLLEQVGKRMCLTEAGRELRTHAGRIAAQMVDLGTAMEQFRDVDRGFIRLSVMSTANYFLPRLIASFTASHPGVRISLEVANREAVMEALAENRTDLAITGQPPDTVNVTSQYFMDNPLVVIAHPSHPLVKLGSVKLRQLEQETLVLRESGSGTRAAVERYLNAHGATYRPGCELSTNEAIKQAVQAGLGLGIVPAQTIELEQETQRLVVLPVEGFPLIRQWFIVHRSDKRLSAAAQAFLTLLLSQNAHAEPRTGQKSAANRPSRPTGSTSPPHHAEAAASF
jgi:DNA-binding transcriptional LysR family regulator